ncbi:methyltransferase domain-containing protein [Chitinophaga qingshengii]|uniref:Methyltransferase domain-containing protein n=1 Tax=Chitinophaga qingshengii TaxID=1569794 RepID=A0ABR7TJN2_9BACT|nr:methyltransferase domain-containing protein [Chitinophaga qingshengii]MBC9930696.1 methyltransferase domain-containing protein [Chitinophaga qingshengii]
METTDPQYWNERYLKGETGWDMGRVSPPLQAYIDQLENRDLEILIPGAGNSYEASYLLEKGFRRVTVLDIAPLLVEALRRTFAGTTLQIVEGDFFKHQGSYDLVLEQTFFCALPPLLRQDYVTHMHTLIRPGGHLAGVLFNRDFAQDGPPFGGSEAEYRELFTPLFEIKTLAPCYNSHPARQGSELFINFLPK